LRLVVGFGEADGLNVLERPAWRFGTRSRLAPVRVPLSELRPTIRRWQPTLTARPSWRCAPRS